jgi:hypothetical protein
MNVRIFSWQNFKALIIATYCIRGVQSLRSLAAAGGVNTALTITLTLDPNPFPTFVLSVPLW